MTFDPTKPVQTRDGRKARIICTDMVDERYPIVALITEETDREFPVSFTADGRILDSAREHDNDLVNIPEKREGWINVYPVPESPWRTPSDWLYPTMEEAIEDCTDGYITTVKVEWTE
jgi:hypothetical protein